MIYEHTLTVPQEARLTLTEMSGSGQTILKPRMAYLLSTTPRLRVRAATDSDCSIGDGGGEDLDGDDLTNTQCILPFQTFPTLLVA